MARVRGQTDGVGVDEMIDLVIGFLVGAAVTAGVFAMYGNPRAEQLEEMLRQSPHRGRVKLLETLLDTIAREFPIAIHGGEASGRQESIALIEISLDTFEASKGVTVNDR